MTSSLTEVEVKGPTPPGMEVKESRCRATYDLVLAECYPRAAHGGNGFVLPSARDPLRIRPR